MKGPKENKRKIIFKFTSTRFRGSKNFPLSQRSRVSVFTRLNESDFNNLCSENKVFRWKRWNELPSIAMPGFFLSLLWCSVRNQVFKALPMRSGKITQLRNGNCIHTLWVNDKFIYHRPAPNKAIVEASKLWNNLHTTFPFAAVNKSSI